MYKVFVTSFIIIFGFFSSFAAYSQCNLKKKLGVSRVIEVDTKGGPLYGRHQYKKTLPLKDGEIVLTFDDGPHPKNTLSVLKTLRDHCTKATFFAVGSMALQFPDVVKIVAAEGHTIGSHTHNHPRMPDIPFERAKIQIERGIAEVIKANGGPIAPFFRFPGLRHSKALNKYIQGRDISVLSVDVISGDTKITNTRGIVARTMRLLKSRKKGMILLHDLKASTARALPTLLNTLKKAGYKVVHIVPKHKLTTAHYTPW